MARGHFREATNKARHIGVRDRSEVIRRSPCREGPCRPLDRIVTGPVSRRLRPVQDGRDPPTDARAVSALVSQIGESARSTSAVSTRQHACRPSPGNIGLQGVHPGEACFSFFQPPRYCSRVRSAASAKVGTLTLPDAWLPEGRRPPALAYGTMRLRPGLSEGDEPEAAKADVATPTAAPWFEGPSAWRRMDRRPSTSRYRRRIGRVWRGR